MSKENNLTDFLTDVANAIREKKGTSSPINPQDFSDEIMSIETGGDKLPKVIDKTITSLELKDLEGISKIGQYSFYGCQNLADIEIPNITTIEQRAFYNCVRLKPIIPNSITTVGDYAFYSAGSSSGVSFDFTPANVCTVSGYAFQSSRVSKVVGKFTSLGNYAFSSCSYLTEVDISQCGAINTYAFNNATSMAKLHLTMNGVLASYAFYGCTKVSDIELSNCNITGMTDYAFSRLGASRTTPAQNVLKLDFSNSTFTIISQYSFGSDSSSYKNQYMDIILPDTVNTINAYAFRYSDHCNYYFNSEKVPTLGVTTAWSNATNYNIFVPYNKVNEYRSATNWTAQANYIKGFSNANEFNIGDTLPEINKEGYGCTWYSDVGCTNVVTTVSDSSAMYYCVVGSEKLAYQITKVTAIDCQISVIDNTGHSYIEGDVVRIGTTLTINATPSTTGYTPYLFTVNGVDFTVGNTLTMTENLAIVGLYWDGQHIPVNPIFSENSWDMIKIGIQTGAGKSFWNVGDTKQVTLTNGETYTIRIADMQDDRYDYSDGSCKSKAVFEFVELQTTSRYMNSSQTNSGGWANCYMRSAVMEEIYNMLPQDLKEVISSVNVLSGTGGSTSSGTSSSVNKLFLPAEMEIFSSKTYSIGNTECPLGQFDWYKAHNTNNDRKKYKLNTTSSIYWWLRSPRSGGSSNFVNVTSYGSADYNDAYRTYGVAPCFAI